MPPRIAHSGEEKDDVQSDEVGVGAIVMPFSFYQDAEVRAGMNEQGIEVDEYVVDNLADKSK